MSAARQSCLFVLSSAGEGVTAQSFAQAYNLANSNFTVQLTSPGGKHIEFINQDDSNRRWINEFRAKSNSTPIALETVDAARYAALVIPDSPGAIIDLQKDQDLQQILSYFVKEKKPICAIGMGVAGLFSGQEENRWLFEDYSLTTAKIAGHGFSGSEREGNDCQAYNVPYCKGIRANVSIYELARSPEFAALSIIPENFIKDHYGKYSCSGEVDSVHVVIDRHVITGQNVQSTIMAVQNLILMCSQNLRNVFNDDAES